MTTSHHNTVTISGSSIVNIKYNSGSIDITEGQPSEKSPVITAPKDSNNQWEIDLYCGRKKSSDVATNFSSKTGGSRHEYAPSGGGGSPDELNFFFSVTITIQHDNAQIPVTVQLAQGSYGATNNWWIGGNSIVNKGSPVLLVISQNSVQEILALSGSHNSITLTPENAAVGDVTMPLPDEAQQGRTTMSAKSRPAD